MFLKPFWGFSGGFLRGGLTAVRGLSGKVGNVDRWKREGAIKLGEIRGDWVPYHRKRKLKMRSERFIGWSSSGVERVCIVCVPKPFLFGREFIRRK